MSKQNHIHVRKNVYTYPSWVVSFKQITIGSAHSGQIAQIAASIAGHYAHMINPSNLCPTYLIDNVQQQMTARGLSQYWTPQVVTAKPVAVTHQKVLTSA